MEQKFTVKAAMAIAGSIGYPSKMPGTSYGIPAAACITGRILAAIEGSTCSKCYAFDRGNYTYPSVKQAQAIRLAGITNDLWVPAMVFLLLHAHERLPEQKARLAKRRAKAKAIGKRYRRKHPKLPPYHRWHDAGDLQSRDHLAKICAVARATPWLMHWVPTREGKILRDFIRDGGTVPPNLIIRLSATMVDGAAPKAWPLTSTVHDKAAANGYSCPAPKQGNACGPCRACWNPGIANISYHIH